MSVTLFLYQKRKSLLHKIPSLIKLIILFALCIFTFKNASLSSMKEILSRPIIVRTSVCAIVSFILFVLSGAKLSSIKNLFFVLVIGGSVTLIRLIHIPFWFDKDGLAFGILYTIRFFITSLASQLVFETTSPLEIKHAIEMLQNLIAKVFPKIKKLNPAFIISLSITFIPEIFSTWNKISLAAKARGGKKTKGKIKLLIQEFSSLFSSLLYHAETKRMAIINRNGLEDE